jgi:uncharacterized OB-fold protein
MSEEIEFAEFWAGTAEGRLLVQKCAACGYLRWPPGPVCNQCQSREFAWMPMSGTGVIESYATYHRALDKRFADDVPYTVGMIELAEGPRLLGRITDEIDDVQIGRTVHATFEKLKDGREFAAWTIERP